MDDAGAAELGDDASTDALVLLPAPEPVLVLVLLSFATDNAGF